MPSWERVAQPPHSQCPLSPPPRPAPYVQPHPAIANSPPSKGAEDNIQLNQYQLVFQRDYDEVEGVLQWKVVEFAFVGEVPGFVI